MNKATRVAQAMLIVLIFMVAVGPTMQAQSQADRSGSSVDNTKMNKPDASKDSPAADQQKENRSDREITRQIRQSVAKDDQLSSYAHNVKIVTQDGQVTLKGTVRSAEEKQAIDTKAKEVAGEDKVTNELNVKTQQ